MAASEAAREVDIEVRALRTMTHRMILTQEEMVCGVHILVDVLFNFLFTPGKLAWRRVL
jgi:hypothetical protein